MSNARDSDVPPVVADYARLFSFAAHELRSPASVVGGYLRMLEMDTDASLSSRHRALIEHASKSCARLVEVIAELSDVGKLDNRTAAIRTERFDLFADLEDVAARIDEGKDRDVTLQLAGASHGAPVTGDRQRVATAFAAIFRALLREQGVPVVLTAERRLVRSGGTTAALVIVAREGEVERAIESTARDFDERRGGMGLSLPIARRVIEHAGGRLWAPSPVDDEDRAMKSAAVVSIPVTD